MQHAQLAIVGAGLTAARAIRSYREAGGGGDVTLFSAEPAFPYHRPPLSKGYLGGQVTDPPFVEDEAFYSASGVELVLGARVTAVAPAERTLTLASGERRGYEQLLVATGAEPRSLRVRGADLEGVFTLRTLADADVLRAAASAGSRAVVVGGGFIGAEVAATLRGRGVEVTLVHLGAGVFDQLGCPQLSDELHALYRENGVELLLGHEVASFEGTSELRAVTTKGGRRVDADLAVVGVGVAPAVELLEGSGIDVDDGVLVDERYETTAAGVFAAGDVARFYDPLYGRRRRIEHWSNADYQGTQVGRVLAGAEGGYDTVSTFFSKVFGIGLQVFGDVSRFDHVTAVGSLAGRDLVATYDDDGHIVAALAVEPSDEAAARLRGLIAARAPLSAVTG